MKNTPTIFWRMMLIMRRDTIAYMLEIFYWFYCLRFKLTFELNYLKFFDDMFVVNCLLFSEQISIVALYFLENVIIMNVLGIDFQIFRIRTISPEGMNEISHIERYWIATFHFVEHILKLHTKHFHLSMISTLGSNYKWIHWKWMQKEVFETTERENLHNTRVVCNQKIWPNNNNNDNKYFFIISFSWLVWVLDGFLIKFYSRFRS